MKKINNKEVSYDSSLCFVVRNGFISSLYQIGESHKGECEYAGGD